MKSYTAVKCRVKEILNERKMSQQELALKLDYSKQYISDFCNNRSTLSLGNAMTVAKALKVTIEELYEWEEEEIK